MSRIVTTRITVETFAFNTLEYSVDGEPVSMANPLDGTKGESVPFYVERPLVQLATADTTQTIETRTSENWVAYEVTEFHTGLIHYVQSRDGADNLAYQIAESYLLRKLMSSGKI